MAKNKNKSYSHNNLTSIFNTIQDTLSGNKKSEEKQTFDRRLIFKLRENMKKINDARELIEKDLEDLPEKFNEFKQKNVDIMRDFGGEFSQDKFGNIQVTNFDEFAGNKEFQKKLEKNNEEYKEVIEEAQKIDKKNMEIRAEKTAEIDWTDVPLSMFPEDISEDQLPLPFMEFVTYDLDESESE